MSSLQNYTNRLLTYYPAQLYIGKEWIIKYYVFNPFTNKMDLKRVKVNRIKSIPERRKFARQLCIEINKKLESGWNPILESDNTRSFTKLKDVIQIYLNSKRKELSENSIRSYVSYIKHLLDYLEIHNADMYCGEFNRIVSSDFMLHIKSIEKIGNRTYNNALAFYRTLFNWMIEYNYITVNPFLALKKIPKRLTGKKRTYFERDELKTLVSFLQSKNKNYLAACMLCYYCFLRPSDIICLKLSNFDFKQKLIFIRSEETKNDKDSYKVIPKALEKYLADIEWGKIKNDDYIFSDTKTFGPGNKKMDSREISRYWNNTVRKNCGFGMNKQFYSLKDSGITYLMADGISPGYVQGQADHSSLEVTNKYNHSQTPEGYNQLRNLAKDI